MVSVYGFSCGQAGEARGCEDERPVRQVVVKMSELIFWFCVKFVCSFARAREGDTETAHTNVDRLWKTDDALVYVQV